MSTLVKPAQQVHYGSWIEIRRDRFLDNLRHFKKISGNSKIMAVVKANAYGHGLLEMARVLKDQVSYLGVSSLHEILELKEHGIETPVFLFGRLFGQELVTAVKSGATLSVSSLEEAQEISRISQELRHETYLHVKIDTGMGRLGIPEPEAFGVIKKIAGLRGVTLEGIYTHFASAEKEDGFTESQFQKFGLLIQALDVQGIHFALRHCSNSAAGLKIKSPILNLARPGLLLYGIHPFPPPASSLFQGEDEVGVFKPVLSLKSRIILLKRLAAGDSVGYGREFTASEPCTVATLPIGYSHGYPVHLSNKSYVLYKGKRYPIAGRVSMDFLSINLGNTSAHTGDEITLLGEDGQESIRAEDLAQWAGTISYEIVTRLTSRLPRLYKDT